jgi:hypothetical protein
MFPEFLMLNVGERFAMGGIRYVKKSSRTAKLQSDESKWIYVGQHSNVYKETQVGYINYSN